MSWSWVLLLRAAWALPPALLGPDGPAWFGTVVPGTSLAGDGRPVAVVVDPRSGELSVVERDAPGVLREWDGHRWSVSGGGVDAEWPPREGFTYTLEEDGALVSSTSSTGVRRRYLYDEQGRLNGILWPDGGRLVVRYGTDGRVRRLDGPGNARRTFRWGAQGDLAVRDTVGRLTRVRPVAPGDLGQSAWEVSDAAGRVVRTWFRQPDGREPLAWQDPRGRVTRVRAEAELVELQGPTGAVWRVMLDDTGRPASVTDPLGAVWRWERGPAGRVRRVVDATGRITVWDRDADGRIRGIERSGQVTRIERDAGGRIRAVRDPTGAEVRIERDASGRVTEVVDPGGSTIQLGRDGLGRVTTLLSRSGGRWSVSYDLLGRPDRIVDPTDRVVLLERDSSGRLVSIDDSRAGRVGIRRDADGRVSGVAAEGGALLGLVRDPLGRITEVRLPSGEALALERDAAGEVSRLDGPWGTVAVRRDGRGLPLEVGPGAWSWDAAGRLTRVGLGEVRLDLRHDASGRLEAAGTGTWRVEIARDGAGRPVLWRGTDPAVSVDRDPAGRIVREETVQGVVSTTWDPRGQVERVQIDDWIWRWSRDGAGRMLRLSGPGGLQLGADHDSAGRLRMVRMPGGALIRWAYEGALTHQTLVDADGRARAFRTEARGPGGRVHWWQEGDSPRIERRRDPDGRVVGEGTAEAPAWRFSGRRIDGPDGVVVEFDGLGRMAAAVPPPGPPAWGVGTARLEVAAPAGSERVGRMAGDGGEVALSWDPVGRLSAVSTPGGLVRIVRDARGRVAGWQSPAEGAVPLAWLPDDAAGEGSLLVSGGGVPRTWLPGPLGPSGFSSGELVVGIAIDSNGDPVAVQAGRDAATLVRHSPMGFPDSGAAGLVGADAWLQPFAGGPLLRGARAVDPVSGRSVDGLSIWPWAAAPVRGTRNTADLRDPDPWAPEAPWADPLRLLLQLGALRPVDDDAWWLPHTEPGAVGWLPDAVDRVLPPLGPPPGGLPLSEDLLARCAIQAALPGGDPLAADDPLVAILTDEVGLDGLPPGVVVPGLEWLMRRDGGCGGSPLATLGGPL